MKEKTNYELMNEETIQDLIILSKKHLANVDIRIYQKGYSVFVSNKAGRVRIGHINDPFDYLLNTIKTLFGKDLIYTPFTAPKPNK